MANDSVVYWFCLIQFTQLNQAPLVALGSSSCTRGPYGGSLFPIESKHILKCSDFRRPQKRVFLCEAKPEKISRRINDSIQSYMPVSVSCGCFQSLKYDSLSVTAHKHCFCCLSMDICNAYANYFEPMMWISNCVNTKYNSLWLNDNR